MAQDSRSPGDISNKTRSSSFRYARKKSYPPNNQDSGSRTQNVFSSRRPVYDKGQVVTLPGGRQFRKATTYAHTSYSVTPNGPFKASGRQWSGIWVYSEVEDHGMEVGYYVDNATYSSSLFGGGYHAVPPTDLRNEVVTKALLKLADQKAGIGEDLATFRQTLSLFVGKGGLLLNALRAVRSRPEWKKWLFKSARDLRANGVTETSAKLYLEYVYGLKPLIDDVYGVAELLKEQGLHTLLINGRAKASRQVVRSTASNWDSVTYSRHRRLQGQATGTARCHLWARIDPSHQGLRSLQQLGLLNPASLAWNLVPWSFVVDWFLPIGPMLEALTAPAGLIFVDGSLGFSSKQSVTYEYQHDSTFIPASVVENGITSRMYPVLESESYNRYVFRNWPLPGAWVNPDPFSGDRALKALALGIAQLGRYKLTVR